MSGPKGATRPSGAQANGHAVNSHAANGHHESGWVRVCPAELVEPDRGVAALVAGRAIALFRLSQGGWAALDNVDPCSGASVLSRGLVGDAAGVEVVASPMYKHRFDLRTGRCLDDDGVRVRIHQVRVVRGTVEVRLEGAA